MIPTKHALDASISARAASGSAGSPGAEGQGAAGSSEASNQSSSDEGLSAAEQLQVHLAAAAEVANGSGVSLDEFMRVAWSAYVDSRPGLREHLADAQLVQQIMELRSQGKVGQA